MKAREPRRRVMVAARLRTQDGWSDVLIRNISSRGMLIETGTVAPKDKYVELRSGPHAVIGRVAWRKNSQFGIQAQDRIDIDALASRPSKPSASGPPKADDDRRTTPRQQSPETLMRTAERSRMIGRASQFAFIGLCVTGAALLIGNQVYDTLASPMRVVTARLAP
jgi:PilZ domain